VAIARNLSRLERVHLADALERAIRRARRAHAPPAPALEEARRAAVGG
jgi:hypothetical protein